MKAEQTAEYVMAFVVGTLVGVGAALVFAPGPVTRREKILKELKPYRQKLQKRAVRARKTMDRRASAASDWSGDLVATGRAVAQDLRREIAALVADARDDLGAAVQTQIASAQGALRRSAKRARR